MELHQLFLANNNCYKAGSKLTPKGIMVHSTGANNPWLKRYVGPDDGLLGAGNNHWNTPLPDGRKVCVHAFIGKLADGSIATYQTLPWNIKGWHAGGKASDTHIGFEICEDALSDGSYFAAVYAEAVELCVYLCKKFNLTENDIICHSEGYKRGIASNHGDVMHWFPKHGKSMDTFREDVKKRIENKEDEPMTAEERTKFNELVNIVRNLTHKIEAIEAENTILQKAIGWNSENKDEPALYAYNDDNIRKFVAEDGNEVIGRLIKDRRLSVDESGAFAPLSKTALRLLVIQNR